MTWRCTTVALLGLAAATLATEEPASQQIAVLSAAGNVGELPTPADASSSGRTTSRGLSAERLAELREMQESLDSLPTAMELMRTAMDGALDVNGTFGLDARVASLLVLQELVEDLDNARDLKAVGGFKELMVLLQSDEVQIQSHALWVLGTAAQNVEEIQRHLSVEVEAMGPILRLLVASSSTEVRAKALYACSALVRAHPAGQRQFEETGGVSALVDLIATEEPLGKLSRKAVVMLTDMLMHADEEAGQEGALGQALRHNATTLCDSLLSHLGSDARDAQEKGMQLLEQMVAPLWRATVRASGACAFEQMATMLRGWSRACEADGDCDETHERAEQVAQLLGGFGAERS
jgi:hypothetical protein